MNRMQLDTEAELTELVAFKWLMAGRGWWVDVPRLRRDPAYAYDCTQRAASSGLDLLAQRTAVLLTQTQRRTLQPA